MSKALVAVLTSGGVDSLLTLALTSRIKGNVNVLPLTFEYGQRWAKEVEAAKALVNDVKPMFRRGVLLEHKIVRIPTLPTYHDWVCGRNFVLAAHAVAILEEMSLNTPDPVDAYVLFGFNLDESTTFEDDRTNFCQALTTAANWGYSHGQCTHYHITSLLFEISKFDEGVLLRYLGIPSHVLLRSYSCYRGGDKPCEQCPSCQHFLRVREGYEWASKAPYLDEYAKLLCRRVCSHIDLEFDLPQAADYGETVYFSTREEQR